MVGAALVGAPRSANAGEGMWVPQQLPEIAGPLKKAGLRLDPKQLADLTGDPMGAVVSLGGCTASFVSARGLVVTNHHCAYGAIQLNSTPDKNLIRDGFNAPAAGDELPAGPNARIYVLDQITDVTAQVKSAIAAAPGPLERTRAVEDLEKKLVGECEAEAGHRCRAGVVHRVRPPGPPPPEAPQQWHAGRLPLPPVQLHGRQCLPPVQEHRDQGRAPGLRTAR